MISQYILSTERSVPILIADIIPFPLKIFIAFLLIPRYFALGFAITECFFRAFQVIVLFYFSFKNLDSRLKNNVYFFFVNFSISLTLIELVQLLNLPIWILILLRLFLVICSFSCYVKFYLTDIERSFLLNVLKNVLKRTSSLYFFK